MKQLLKIISIIMIVTLSFSGIFIGGTADAKAGKKFTVSLKKCTDGDTAHFTKVGKTRFLYIDTPESTNKVEAYGKEASQYTCNRLKKAKKIQLQYDGDKTDKYGRTLAWVWVDGSLLQKDIIKKGYNKRFYDYGTYSYEDELIKLQKQAQKNRVGYWSKNKPTSSK